ncbi:BNR-4 repeat-containing protein [Natronosporangium hydrolyticum]|uniref:BNR-4 repeat-containing protein n=1 Tax=Natronosporangium hydrolyticum TaxID=2811111 RepID=A0A895YFR2_9ACTN|nr:BNR-4 repeat-containing protein [Natronosporangium hydrolyticum]QSB16704.1 BNR-4 repeat-containing protein [Natronosporangium hydrolyticum]
MKGSEVGSAGRPSVVNDNGAWCWFQDERALVDAATQTLVVGSIAVGDGPGGEARSGNVELAVVDLRTGTSTIVVLHERLEADDHNVPALWRRSDGRWLAVYARHKTDDLTRWRISEPGDPTRWGPERSFDWSELTGGRGVTYSNLHALDGRLYCFVRAVNDDPCALVSDDEGATWTYAGKLFTRPKVGYVNGYTRYVSDGARIDLVTTDHHPRDFDNCVYHGYVAGGALYRSDGSVVDETALTGDAPSQEKLTTVLAGSSQWGGEWMTHCWTTDIRRSADGTVAAVLTARAGAAPASAEAGLDSWRPVPDLRFFYARMSPSGEWEVHQLAHAGPGLLPHEQDYTGLAAIDPYDLGSLYVSTPVDPRDGSVMPHYEIFHAYTSDGGATWRWRPITEKSDVDNLRPIVAPGDPGRVPLLWFRGAMTASQHYRCEVVLLDTPRDRRD